MNTTLAIRTARGPAVVSIGLRPPLPVRRPACGVANLPTRLVLAVVTLLIAMIGGRATPKFSRNGQPKRGGPPSQDARTS